MIIHLIVNFKQDGDNVRCDLASLGDVTPDEWKPGRTETGPNYFAHAIFPGTVPAELPEDAVRQIGRSMRAALLGEAAKLIVGGGQ